MSTGLGDKAARRAQLIAAIRFAPAEAACRACLDNLDDYIAAQFAGQAYPTHFPAVTVHLDACPDCATAYARLYELELAEATGRLPQPGRLPTPDLSFLPTSRPSLADQLRAAVTHLGDRLRFQLSADLLPLLQPTPAVGLRAPADAGRYSQQLLSLDPAPDLQATIPFQLAAYRDARRPDHCLVELTAAPLGRAWPDLAGITVRLTWPHAQRQTTTDPWGLASFEDVPVAHLDQLSIELTI